MRAHRSRHKSQWSDAARGRRLYLPHEVDQQEIRPPLPPADDGVPHVYISAHNPEARDALLRIKAAICHGSFDQQTGKCL